MCNRSWQRSPANVPRPIAANTVPSRQRRELDRCPVCVRAWAIDDRWWEGFLKGNVFRPRFGRRGGCTWVSGLGSGFRKRGAGFGRGCWRGGGEVFLIRAVIRVITVAISILVSSNVLPGDRVDDHTKSFCAELLKVAERLVEMVIGCS